MNNALLDARELLAAALIPGEIIVPQRLLDTVERLPRIESFLFSEGHGVGPFEVFNEEYPGLHLMRLRGRSLDSTEREKAVGLLRWVLRELSAWTREGDPRRVKMSAVMAILDCFAWRDVQWASFPETAVNSALIDLLGKIVSRICKKDQGEAAYLASSKNDLEASLAKADSEGDWAAVAKIWQRFEFLLNGEWFLGHAVRCLARFDMARLAAVMNQVEETPMAFFVASSLSHPNRLRLARATSAQRYRFAAVLSIAGAKRELAGLSHEAESELSALLAEVSQSEDQWQRWMQAFNETPIPISALQRSLGRALAQAPENALKSYVDSISLHPWSLNGPPYRSPSRTDGGKCVALCLTTFSEVANPEQRCRLWQLAHTRWHGWDFGLQSSSERHLMGFVGSELDYAITAHAAECLTSAERAAQLASLVRKVRDIEMSWYASISDLGSRRNAFLSRMQPLLAADSPDRLFTQPAIPQDLVETPYIRRKFGA